MGNNEIVDNSLVKQWQLAKRGAIYTRIIEAITLYKKQSLPPKPKHLFGKGFWRSVFDRDMENFRWWLEYDGVIYQRVNIDSLDNETNCVDYTINDTDYPASVPRYRGIENPFGHIW